MLIVNRGISNYPEVKNIISVNNSVDISIYSSELQAGLIRSESYYIYCTVSIELIIFSMASWQLSCLVKMLQDKLHKFRSKDANLHLNTY